MQTIDSLLSTAFQDTELLKQLDQDGDDFSVARDVDFVLKTEELKKAELIESFVTDNQYGVPRVEETDEGYRLIVTVHMPITQHVLCSVSALLACLAQLFAVEYDGWGCVVQRST
jgi:regulator of RNase E activity RraB